MANGILYGVSTGPGDPELMTVKAIRCVEQVQVIAAPRTNGKNSMALDIVKGMVDLSGKEICYLDFSMGRNTAEVHSEHKAQAAQLEAYLAEGKNVAMLNIGDASLYGTFCYLRDIVENDGYSTVTIPGVTSFCAVAAALGQSLTNKAEPMTVIPGSYGDAAAGLDRPGTKVLMKSGSALGDVKRVLEEKGLTEKAAMVANCGLPGERIYRDIRESTDDEGYFVTILVDSPGQK